MWFQFPEGCGGISVELQHFAPEVTDKQGRKYFRAPNHFAPKILMLKGFAQVEPPEGSPADLPQPDPLRDGAIEQLTKESEAQKMEINNLRSDLIVATGKVTALVNEKGELEKKITTLEATIEDLEEKLEDKPAPTPAKPALVASAKK